LKKQIRQKYWKDISDRVQRK